MAFSWAVCAFAFFVKYLTGFGNTLLFTTLLSFQMPTSFLTPADLLLNLPANLSVVWSGRRRLLPQKVLRILALVLTGVLPGVLFLKAGSVPLMKLLLGLLVAVLGLQGLLERERPASPEKPLSPFVLAGCGFALGAFGVGAVLAAYLSRRLTDPEEFRGTLCSVFLLENLFRAGAYTAAGLLSGPVLRFDLALLPTVLGGLALGALVRGRLKSKTLKKGVQLLLTVSGAALFCTNLAAL